MISTIVAAAFGTVAFAVLFGVPRRYCLHCGLTGCAGWTVYCLLTNFAGLSAAEATFFATLLAVFLSRILAVHERCPVTVFVIAGIIPLVPGAGIYWTAYYLVTGQLAQARESGFSAIKIAFAIVLGIVFVFELPQKLFRSRKS